jgi:uncharacterized protein YlxP (DUF503 family)
MNPSEVRGDSNEAPSLQRLAPSETLGEMFIAVARLTLAFTHGRAVQSKRSTVRQLIDKVRHRFGVSAADVEPNGPGDRATIGLALVSSSRRRVEADLSALVEYVRDDTGAHVMEELAEIYSLSELAAIGEPTLADVEGLKHSLVDDREEQQKRRLLEELRQGRRRREEADD